jgi:hypothetical protein
MALHTSRHLSHSCLAVTLVLSKIASTPFPSRPSYRRLGRCLIISNIMLRPQSALYVASTRRNPSMLRALCPSNSVLISHASMFTCAWEVRCPKSPSASTTIRNSASSAAPEVVEAKVLGLFCHCSVAVRRRIGMAVVWCLRGLEGNDGWKGLVSACSKRSQGEGEMGPGLMTTIMEERLRSMVLKRQVVIRHLRVVYDKISRNHCK